MYMSAKISSKSSKKSGNTRQISPSKKWCFTLNNYTENDIKVLESSDSAIVPYFVFQKEIGENGTNHLQGMLIFKTKKRPKGFFKNQFSQEPHWEKCRNAKAAEEYCQKEDTRMENTEPYIRGFGKKYTLTISLYKWEREIIDILNTDPNDRDINYVIGRLGNNGKTTFAKYVFLNFPKVVVLGGKKEDMKMGIINYEKINHHLPEIVLINLPRCLHDYTSWGGIEEIKNMFFFSGKYEGGMVCGKPPHVVIFSNVEPPFDKLSLDRWKVWEIEGNNKPLKKGGVWGM